jgi:hypothetical protein
MVPSTRILIVIVALCLVLSAAHVATSQNLQVQIEEPTENSKVGLHEIVSGRVSDPDARPYVLVHPMLTDLWWVQRRPSPPNRDGSWRTLCYFGTQTQGVGEFFEIVAIVTDANLKEGQTLEDLPSGAIRSDIVMVERTR